jgi:NADH-quinone oxidoreductase subunit M
MVAFIIGGLVSMGMPGLSGFVAEFPILLGVWQGGTMELSNTAAGLNPATYYPIIAVLVVFAIVITAAYILRAVGSVFFGDYDEHKWHDMRPIISLDKIALVGFVVIMIVIGLFPSIIAPVVESGVTPVVTRLQEVQHGQAANILGTAQTAASNLIHLLGGA